MVKKHGEHSMNRKNYSLFLGALLFLFLLLNKPSLLAQSLFSANLKLTTDPQSILKEKTERFLQSVKKDEINISNEPHYQSANPAYYRLPVENGSTTSQIVVVADEAEGKPPLFYIDINQNGDLTDDGILHWELGDDGMFQMEASIPHLLKGTEVLSLRFKFTRIIWTRGNKSKAFYLARPQYCRFGQLQIGSFSYAITVHNNGGFCDLRNLTLGIDLDRDGKIEDTAISDELFEGTEPFHLAGQSYEIAGISNDGEQIQVKPSSLKTNPKSHLRIGSPAPDIVLQILNGKKTQLSEYHGKALLLEFWTTYCPPCISILPELKNLYGQWDRTEFEIIGVSLDEAGESGQPDSLLRSFASKFQIPWPIAITGNGLDSDIARAYNVTSFPLSILLDPFGRIISIDVPNAGIGRTAKQLQKFLEKRDIKTPAK
jgi:thiol-disulfide isomerase/thioredoxin